MKHSYTCALALLLTLFMSIDGASAQTAPPATTLYLIEQPSVAREWPTRESKVVNQYLAGSIVLIRKAVKGWFRVKPATARADSEIEGWIPADPDSLIPDDVLSASFRAVKVKSKPWPIETKNAIIKKRVYVGFTREQIEIALGTPSRESHEESASGTTDVLFYAGQAITLTAGRVSSVTSK